MDKTPKHRSRRSHPNLQLFTVKPLTSLPLDPNNAEAESQSATRQSYLESRSLPQTPSSILSRSNSRSRSRVGSRSSSQAVGDLVVIDGPTPSPSAARVPHHYRTKSGRLKVSDSRDWLLQTASALATSAAESKGQTWLATRTSSTSLANVALEIPESAYRADDEISPVSTRFASRPQSRAHSRPQSRHSSRRGSRVGLMTPLGVRTPGDRDEREDYFDNMSVDFVDSEMGDDYSEGEEGEVRQLVLGRARGWVDWAVGWLDFRDEDSFLAEDEEEEKTEAQDAETEETKAQKRRRAARRRQLREAIGNTQNVPPPPQEGAGVLSDAAWLFGVARAAVV